MNPLAHARGYPPAIYTLTGNLLAERTLEFADWAPGRTQRALRDSFQVGGKGINVSKMLHRLGVPNTALAFVGGASGAECEDWLRERPFASRLFRTTTPTRIGTVVRGGGNPETTFFSPDRPPDDAAIRACAAFLDSLPDGSVLALCGSFPGWTDLGFDPLRAALVRWLGRAHLLADTYGPPLAWVAERPLAMVKLNAEELGQHHTSTTTAELSPAIQRWVITDGPRPVRYRDVDGSTGSLAPPVITEVSPVGSGDVLLACLIEALFRRNLTLPKALTFALPYAAANAAHPGVAEFALPL